ncbi:hypothetical protein ACFQ0B_65130 [Nonomuraea thailandensis]
MDDREAGGKGEVQASPFPGLKGEVWTAKGEVWRQKGEVWTSPNPLSTPQLQSSSSPYGVEEEPTRPAADHHPEDDEKINKEDDNPNTPSRAARVITKRIGCPLDEAERIAQTIARDNHVRKALHLYVAGIPAADLRGWRETTRNQEAQEQTKAARTTRPAGRCHIHFQTLPCIGCAADAKARKDHT